MGINPILPDSLLKVNVSNTGNWPMKITSVEFSGNNPTDFSLADASGLKIVPPSQSYALGVTFHPASQGSKTATMTIHYNDGIEDKSTQVELSGTGFV